METPQPLPVTVEELKARYLRACELKQTVNWERIVECFQRWAAAMNIEVSAIVRVEGVEQLKKTTMAAQAAWDASIPNDAIVKTAMVSTVQAWAALQEHGELQEIDALKERSALKKRVVTAVVLQSLKWAEWAARAARVTSAKPVARASRSEYITRVLHGASDEWIPKLVTVIAGNPSIARVAQDGAEATSRWDARVTKAVRGVCDEWIARARNIAAGDASAAKVARDGWDAKSAWAARAARDASAAGAASLGLSARVAVRPRIARNGISAWDATWMCITAIGAVEYCNVRQFLTWYPLFEALEAGAFCFFFTERGIEVGTLPSVVNVDENNRLHSATGPAFVWLKDVRDFYWHGVHVEPYVVETPERITVADIEAEPNAEVRRTKIERFGQARYLVAASAQEIHRDDFGTLYRKEIPGNEPLVMVKVVNATPEPDGSFKDYFLRVPPGMQTAREAVAWTFGKAPDEYGPEKES